MLYSDLIEFEPIESVIQLVYSARSADADRLVNSYVFSEDMADWVINKVFPQMSLENDVDHKGILVVGNYGTGKSHLMSVLSLVAEDKKFVSKVNNKRVAQAASEIAGKFKVHRIEISSERSLRDIITHELEKFLKHHSVDFSFPSADKITNNKDAFAEMMEVFSNVYPEHGILLLVDEIFDYLKSRDDNKIVQDLQFLREVGEVTKNLRFRFIGGVQEDIFSGPQFRHISDSILRVKDRFAQVFLVPHDIRFVVAARLLKKNVEQKEKIRAYLEPFSKYYGSMNERMDDFVNLFPVHPDYIDTFDKLVFRTEKRGALVTLSDQIGHILDEKVPSDHPGVIGYDSFWDTVTSNSLLRTDPNIKEVLKVSKMLTERVKKGMTRPQYTPVALRVINALSVQRLTTGGNFDVDLGPTTAELRDELCLFYGGIVEMSGEPDANLLSFIETVIQETIKTVNGQFISKTQIPEKYYLDLKKHTDYDALIEERTETLAKESLNRSYYAAIVQLMEQSDDMTYVVGHKIWQYQIEWIERRVHRIGYLFFGLPETRPTAQPERDFYIYFTPPFNSTTFKSERKSDELFFKQKNLENTIQRDLALHAASLELSSTSSGDAKSVYTRKSNEALDRVMKWLQENPLDAYEVEYQGHTETLGKKVSNMPRQLREMAGINPNDTIRFRDVINVVSGTTFSAHFKDIGPEYPEFSSLVSKDNRKLLVGSALRFIAEGKKSRDAFLILDGLGLLDGDRIDPSKSKYAKSVLSALQKKGHNQSLNRDEILEGDSHHAYFLPKTYRIEPDLLFVVLLCLVYSGDIFVTLTGARIEPSNMKVINDFDIDDLVQFKYIRAPKGINTDVLRKLFEMIEIQPGLAQQIAAGNDDAVKIFQERVVEIMDRIFSTTTDMESRLSFWGLPIMRSGEVSECHRKIDSLKTFVENLSHFDTVGKLKSLSISAEDIAGQKENYRTLISVENTQKLISKISNITNYLTQAEMILSDSHEWCSGANEVRKRLYEEIVSAKSKNDVTWYRKQLMSLKREYISIYSNLHTSSRLGKEETRKKNKLLQDPRWDVARSLADISLMPVQQLTKLEESITGLKSCSSLIDSDLESSPFCPHCEFKPGLEQGVLPLVAEAVSHFELELNRLLESWTNTLLGNIRGPVVQSNLELIKKSYRKHIDAFSKSGLLPDPIDRHFITAVQEALSGLEKVVVSGDNICEALLEGGSPATADELRERFENFLSGQCGDNDSTKLRFVVEWTVSVTKWDRSDG